MKLSVLLFVGAAFCASILRAGPVDIFANFGAGDPYSTISGLSVNQADGVSFVVPATNDPGFVWSLTDIQVAAYDGVADDTTTVSVYGDSAGTPGDPIETLSVSFGTDPTNALVTTDSLSNPVLTSGRTYWIVLSDGNSFNVNWNNGSGSGIAYQSGGSWVTSNGYTQGAFEVDATLVPGPEPGTSLALASGLFALIALSRWWGGRFRLPTPVVETR